LPWPRNLLHSVPILVLQVVYQAHHSFDLMTLNKGIGLILVRILKNQESYLILITSSSKEKAMWFNFAQGKGKKLTIGCNNEGAKLILQEKPIGLGIESKNVFFLWYNCFSHLVWGLICYFSFSCIVKSLL